MKEKKKDLELAPCVFCHSKSDLSIEGGRARFVVCRFCGATGPYAQDDELAAKRWAEPKRNDFEK